MVEGASRRVFGETDRRSGVGLGVAIDEEGGLPCCGETSREIHRRGCFSYSAFLVGNGDDSHHGAPGSEKSNKGGFEMQDVSRRTKGERWKKVGRLSLGEASNSSLFHVEHSAESLVPGESDIVPRGTSGG